MNIKVMVCSYNTRYAFRWDCLKCFTFHPLADQFIMSPSQLVRETFSHAAITARSLFLTFLPLPVVRYTFIHLSELGHRGENENDQASKRQQRGLQPGLSRLRVRRSTAELPHSTQTCSILKTCKSNVFHVESRAMIHS